MSYPTTVKSFPTLKGIFSVPKVTHRRDFLRENKLSLRDLERETAEKIASKEPKRPKWMPPEHPQRRSASQSRNNDHTSSIRSGSQTHLAEPTALASGRSLGSRNIDVNSIESLDKAGIESKVSPRSMRRAPSKTSIKTLTKQQQQAPPQQSIKSETGGYEPFAQEQLHMAANERCRSCGTAIESSSSKSSLCDRAIQTDEIVDEHFLAKALLKCSKSNSAIDADVRSLRNGLPITEYEPDDYNQISAPENDIPLSGRSQYCKQSGYRPAAGGDGKEIDIEADVRSLHQRFGDLELDEVPKDLQYEENEEGQVSARSRQTIRSNISNKSKKLRLPRYLVREKNEKAEQEQRAREIDPDCPPDHVRLTDQERIDALAGVKKKYETLINELNRLPMTTQTLRVKTRRTEIDRELAVVEEDMRVFMKPKVYVRR